MTGVGVGVGTALTHLCQRCPLYCPRAALLDRAGIFHSGSPLASEDPLSGRQVGQDILTPDTTPSVLRPASCPIWDWVQRLPRAVPVLEHRRPHGVPAAGPLGSDPEQPPGTKTSLLPT